jgi:hypothetical protein
MLVLIQHRHRQPGGRFVTVALPEAVGFRDPERFEEANNSARLGVDFEMTVRHYRPSTDLATRLVFNVPPTFLARTAASGQYVSGIVASGASQPIPC